MVSPDKPLHNGADGSMIGVVGRRVEHDTQRSTVYLADQPARAKRLQLTLTRPIAGRLQKALTWVGGFLAPIRRLLLAGPLAYPAHPVLLTSLGLTVASFPKWTHWAFPLRFWVTLTAIALLGLGAAIGCGPF
jgi:hypothetical protein